MATFVDTSALYALLDSSDDGHASAGAAFDRLLDQGDDLVSHNYVVVETAALVARRLGRAAVRDLFAAMAPVLRLLWITPDIHERAVVAMLASERARFSLVDRVSFEVMTRGGIEQAFTLDRDFASQGFAVLP